MQALQAELPSATIASDPDARILLDLLGWSATPPAALAARRDRDRLLAAASHFESLFRLDAPDAPGLAVFGARVRSRHDGPETGACGVGLTEAAAFAGCVGEGVEFMSQFPTGDVAVVEYSVEAQAGLPGGAHAARLAQRLAASGSVGWVTGCHLGTSRPTPVPADLCLRREGGTPPPYPLSIGCAAGPTLAAAALHGALETIERDAACLWWRGGMPPRRLPDDDAAARAAADTLSRLRQDASGRSSWLLDITSDLHIPCVVAVSCRPDGRGVAFGVAARMTRSAAAQAAVLELCQMELAARLAAHKRAHRGEAALGPTDFAHLRRYEELDAHGCPLLRPAAPAPAGDDAETHPERALRIIVERLADCRLDLYAVDLTQSRFGIPVVQVVCPGLEVEPSTLAGPRLRAAIELTGGGLAHTSDISLY